MKTHKHHVVPKHAGGDDSPDNLVELSIKEHALAHKKLFEEYRRWQDRVAWLSLMGIMQDEERIYEIISNSNKGNPSNWKMSKAQKEKLSKSRLGDKNPMHGKPAHNRGIKRPGIGGRKKGTLWSDEERKKQESIRSKDGYYDYLQNPERCKKISESNKGRKGAATGKKWYNNGVDEGYFNVNEQPDNWNLGRIKRPSSKIGMLWYNNGMSNRQFKENKQPEEYIRGRISKK
jgi:hypothetical protein|tara:strand:- start:2923 stop:3618 length:696 start_codon:yes stop_codon:yes gene_type:complete